MAVLTITVICVCSRGWKDHPGTNCPFHAVHTRRLLFGLRKNALFAKSMIVYCSTWTLSSEESLLQNRPSWGFLLPTPFLSTEPFTAMFLGVHLMQLSSVISRFDIGLEWVWAVTWAVHWPLICEPGCGCPKTILFPYRNSLWRWRWRTYFCFFPK